MSTAPTIPMRFQRAELEKKADLSPEGLLCLSQAAHPERLVRSLIETGNSRDATYALAMILPHRQSVWWGCLAARILPDLASRQADLAAVEIAERWVQSGSAMDAERAPGGARQELAEVVRRRLYAFESSLRALRAGDEQYP